MEDIYPFRYTFVCECNITYKNQEDKNMLYTLNTNLRIGDIHFINKRILLRKYKKMILSKLKEDANILKYDIVKADFDIMMQ
jgi:hypothetical protein